MVIIDGGCLFLYLEKNCLQDYLGTCGVKEKGAVGNREDRRQELRKTRVLCLGSSQTGPFTEVRNIGGAAGFGEKVMNSVLNFWTCKCFCDGSVKIQQRQSQIQFCSSKFSWPRLYHLLHLLTFLVFKNKQPQIFQLFILFQLLSYFFLSSQPGF